MVASLDGFIARKDGRVDFLETADEFPSGVVLDAAAMESVLGGIDCYVMGARTWETALRFESSGAGWAYGDKPVFVATHRDLPKANHPVEFWAGDLGQLLDEKVKPRFKDIWVVGGGALCGECLRLGLVDEVRYAMVPIVIGEGIRFFEEVGRDVPMHLVETTAYSTGMVELRYQVKRQTTMPSQRETHFVG